MSKRFLITIITILVIGVAAGVAVFFAKGYTFSPIEKRVVGTGILNITSEPDAASVYIDGHLTTATNATVSSLSPKEYTIKVIKEGFIPWEKKIEIKEGLVTEAKVTLFPSIPTIYPLTFTGVDKPVLSLDGSKLGYIVPSGKKAGVWVWTMVKNQPLNFARGNEPHHIADNKNIDYSIALLKWSPDSKQLIATVDKSNYLLDSDTFNFEPRDITPILDGTLKSWDEDTKEKESLRVLSIKDSGIRKVASDSAIIKWSPDEKKFMYRESPLGDQEKTPDSIKSGFKVYDLEENKSYDLPSAKVHLWLPTSSHLVMVEDNSISIIDLDGTNKAVIYAGNFINSFVFPWPDSSRLVILSTFPTPTASEPNLYGINLR